MSDDSKTLWCGNLAEPVTEELLHELFLQAGPLQKVAIPRDKNGRNKNFAFVTFNHDVSVPYAMHLFRGTALFHKTLSLKPRGRIVDLPPPIRCTTIDPTFTLSQKNIKEQFENMTENLNFDSSEARNDDKEDNSYNKLSIASLQGNWSHRHHPYTDDRRRRDRGDQRRHNRDDHRRIDKHDRGNGDHSERHRDHNDWRQKGFRKRNNRDRY